MRRFAYVGPVSNELLSFRGAVLVHTDRAEMEYLVPGCRVVELPRADLGRPLMPLSRHPDLAAVQWPLRKELFR